jgi:hypothetical protein
MPIVNYSAILVEYLGAGLFRRDDLLAIIGVLILGCPVEIVRVE